MVCPDLEEFFQRIHPDDQPGFRELMQTAIREKAEGRRTTASYIWMALSGTFTS